VKASIVEASAVKLAPYVRIEAERRRRVDAVEVDAVEVDPLGCRTSIAKRLVSNWQERIWECI